MLSWQLCCVLLLRPFPFRENQPFWAFFRLAGISIHPAVEKRNAGGSGWLLMRSGGLPDGDCCFFGSGTVFPLYLETGYDDVIACCVHDGT